MAMNITARVKRYKAYVMTLNTKTANVQTLPVFSKSSDPEKIMKIARRLFAGTHNVPAKVEQIETIEKLYTVDIDTFINNAERIEKSADIKGDAITRTIKGFTAELMCLNTERATVEMCKWIVQSSDEGKILKQMRKEMPPHLVPGKVLRIEKTSEMYGMTLEKFTHIAKEVTE